MGRVLGTLSGAAVAVVSFTVLRESSILLSIFGTLFSTPFFWLIITRPTTHAPTARFTLLTYNLTCLYAYNLREDNELDVFEIAAHRSVVSIVAFAHHFWPSVLTRNGIE